MPSRHVKRVLRNSGRSEQESDHRAAAAGGSAEQAEPDTYTAVDADQPPHGIAWEAQVWAPDVPTALRMFLLLRLTGAVFAPIMDCDETFNYWEPLHYMMYGRGYQTWEYAPDFALRSYGYLLPHAAASYASGAAFGLSKTHSFALLRVLLAIFTVFCEMYLFSGIKKRCGNALAASYLWTSLFMPGLWHAAPAFIPSAFALQCTALAYGAFLRGKQHYPLAVFIAAASVLLGWPFAGLVFLPMGLHILVEACLQISSSGTGAKTLAKVVGAGIAGIVLPAVYSFAVDSWFYGRPVLPVWNIIKYNVLGQGGDGSGSELYGVEPASYYIKNLALNFHVALPAAVVAPLVLLLLAAMQQVAGKRAASAFPTWVSSTPAAASLATTCAAVFLWVGFMTSNPHKEERFLFPVYALIPLLAAMGLRGSLHLVALVLQKCGATSPTVAVSGTASDTQVQTGATHRLSSPSRWAERLVVLYVCICMLLFLGRAGILHMAYSAPMSAWAHVSHISLGGFVNTYPVSKQFNMEVPFLPIALASLMGWRPQQWAKRITARDNATVEAARVLSGWGAPARGAQAWLSDSAMDLPFKMALSHGMNSSTAAKRWVAEASLPHQPLPTAPQATPTADFDQLNSRGHSNFYGGRVCVGKEWYRVPSHHFTPGVTSAGLSSLPARTGMPPRTVGGPLQLAFVQGGFGGHLPQLFLHPSLGGSHANVSGFNDRNSGDPSVFVDPSTCDFVVDLHLPGAGEGVDAAGVSVEPWFAGARRVAPDAGVDDVGRRMANEGGEDPPLHAAGVVQNEHWISVWSGWFLAGDRAPAWSRALYVPWVSERAWEGAGAWVRYRLLARKDVAHALAPYALQGMVIPTTI